MQIPLYKENTYNKNPRYTCDLNFGALKKSALTPLKKTFCEMYHPPLEKMNNVSDLTTWVEKSWQKLKEPHSLKGVDEELATWREGLENLDKARNRNSVYWKYIIYDSLVRLKTSYIEHFDMNTVLDTINSTKTHLAQEVEKFNFHKKYIANLKEKALAKYFPNKERTGWVGFIGKRNPSEQAEQVKDIRALSSGTNWCTKGGFFSNLAIEDESHGLYIYLKDGKTMYGVRTENNLTFEIKNQHNESAFVPKEIFSSLQELNPKIQLWSNWRSMVD